MLTSKNLQDGWRVTVDGVVGMLPPIADLEALIGGLGIDNDTTVVVIPVGVNSTDFGSAARIYWTFDHLGHDQVAILDGGHRAWLEAGLPLETGLPAVTATTFTAAVRPELLVDTAFVAAHGDDVVLLDARPESQYQGETKIAAAKAAGHIPGAINLDHAQTFDATTGQLKSADTSGYLEVAKKCEASALFLVANEKPTIRHHGHLVRLP